MSKCVLITGAAQGIGACIAETFAAKGYNIAVNCRSQDDVEGRGSLVATKCRNFGVEAECLVGDVTDFQQCGKLVKETMARFGSLDVLVNNAGITKDGLIATMGEKQFDDVISVNLKGVFNMIHHASRAMIRARQGRIINISSVAGLYGNPGQINYSASKAGVIGITLTASKELGPRNITVNAVAPGFIQTAMTDALPEKAKANILDSISLRRLGSSQDVANAVVFFASEEASYITGQVLVIDGGLAM